jgi:hypothetical protein
VQRLELDIDHFENDPGRWGASLANNAELLLGTLDAAGVRSVAEVGAYAGDLTRLLLRWAERAGATVMAIDPYPKPPLEQLDAERDDLELVRATSHEALKTVELTDAVILDGDHNYWVVDGELRIIAERAEAAGQPLPLLLFHDVGWPHGRRDLYEDPDAVPAEHRHPMREGGGLFPGVEGIRPGGLPMRASAEREGGPRNGVLTAIEDFAEERPDLRLVVIPSFFGLGILWSREAPYSDALAELLDPWDRNPLLERLEANRVLHLASSHFHMVQAGLWQQRDWRKVELLKKLLESKAFAVGQVVSRLRQRGEPAFSKAEVRALLDETDRGLREAERA